MMDILDNIYESSSNGNVYGMGNTCIEDITNYCRYQLESIIDDNNLDINIEEISIDNTFVNDNPYKEADLEVNLYYTGHITPEDFSELLDNDDYNTMLIFDKIQINVHPIQI